MRFFQQAVPFPGTAFYSWAKENGYLDCLVDYPYAEKRVTKSGLNYILFRIKKIGK